VICRAVASDSGKTPRVQRWCRQIIRAACAAARERGCLATLLISTVFRRGNHMNWLYWNTAWSLFFSLVWFMTITHNPDAQITDAHLRDEAFGG
jgi:hypothetical protein